MEKKRNKSGQFIPTLDKNGVIKAYLASGLNAADTAREIGCSRERVSQILEEVYDTRDLLAQYTKEIDWDSVNNIKNTFGLTSEEIARKAECDPNTVRHILTGSEAYIKNSWALKSHAAVRIVEILLEIARDRLDKLENNLTNLQVVLDKHN